MTGPKRDKLTIVLDVIIVLVFVLLLMAIALQVYAFKRYQADVLDNRRILCEAPSLVHERYCAELRSQILRTERRRRPS